jgi:hypothetical protein
MILPHGVKVTSEILWKGALIFALIDVVFVSVLTRRIKLVRFLQIKWALMVTMAVFFTLIWGILASYVFWDSVYHYFFPEWSRWFIPPVYGLLFSAAGLLFWWIALKLPGNAVINFCLLGGFWGMITHLWAIHRGILEKPPLLQGASSVAAVVIAIFEFMFYWCIVLSIASLLKRNDGSNSSGVLDS